MKKLVTVEPSLTQLSEGAKVFTQVCGQSGWYSSTEKRAICQAVYKAMVGNLTATIKD